MKRRPVCLVCLILLLCMYVLDLAGIPLVSGNPLPEKTREWIAEHPEAVIMFLGILLLFSYIFLCSHS